MTDDELNDWGLTFVELMDEEFSDNEDYQGGQRELVMRQIKFYHPDLTEAQMEWLEDFYGEA